METDTEYKTFRPYNHLDFEAALASLEATFTKILNILRDLRNQLES